MDPAYRQAFFESKRIEEENVKSHVCLMNSVKVHRPPRTNSRKSLRPTGMLFEISAREQRVRPQGNKQTLFWKDAGGYRATTLASNLFLNAHDWEPVTQAGWRFVPCVRVYFRKYALNSLCRAKSQAFRTDLWGLLKSCWRLTVWFGCRRKLT